MGNLLGRCNGMYEQSGKNCTNEKEGSAIFVDAEEQKDKRMRKTRLADGIRGTSVSGTIYAL